MLSNKNWDDEDSKDDVEFILEKLNAGVQDLRFLSKVFIEIFLSKFFI